MTAADLRATHWDVRAPAGASEPWTFVEVNAAAITSLSVWLGGSLADIDDFTDATEYEAVISGDDDEIATTPNIPIPTSTAIVPLRLVVDGDVVTVGHLLPATDGQSSVAEPVRIATAGVTVNLTVSGAGAVASLAARVAVLEQYALVEEGAP